VPLPPQSPHLNAYVERWARLVMEEALPKLILFGEQSLRHTLKGYMTHFQTVGFIPH
jgi:putative transposase